jgi:hypothetical protein
MMHNPLEFVLLFELWSGRLSLSDLLQRGLPQGEASTSDEIIPIPLKFEGPQNAIMEGAEK